MASSAKNGRSKRTLLVLGMNFGRTNMAGRHVRKERKRYAGPPSFREVSIFLTESLRLGIQLGKSPLNRAFNLGSRHGLTVEAKVKQGA